MSEKQLSLVFSMVLCYSNCFVLPDSFPSKDAFLLSMDTKGTLNLLCMFYKLFTIMCTIHINLRNVFSVVFSLLREAVQFAIF